MRYSGQPSCLLQAKAGDEREREGGKVEGEKERREPERLQLMRQLELNFGAFFFSFLAFSCVQISDRSMQIKRQGVYVYD